MTKCLPGPVKDFLRTARNGGCGSAWQYLLSSQIRKILPGLARELEPGGVEVHVLSGGSRLTMALWMMASWIAATQRAWRFVIHDDGTLQSAHVNELKALFPDCRVILDSESTPIITDHLKTYPLSLKCRNLHPLGRRLVDFPKFAAGDRFFSIDTDVLFFERPGKLLEWCALSGPHSIFFEDLKEGSLLSAAEVKKLFGVTLTPRVNAGMIAVPKNVLNLNKMEACLDQTPILQGDHWYIEQTLYAVLASVYGSVELLPKEYFMSLDPSCPPGTLARHYVGAIRHLFYSEGIPRVRQNISRSKRT